MDAKQQQSQLKLLIAKGKEQGYLTYREVNDHLPDTIVDPEQIEDIVNMINDMGIDHVDDVFDPEHGMTVLFAARTDQSVCLLLKKNRALSK